jgi:hypothetical protein
MSRLATCGCDETFILETDPLTGQTTKRVFPYNPRHSCGYIKERNSFILDAHIYAKQQATLPNGLIDTIHYTKEFSRKMDALCAHLVG